MQRPHRRTVGAWLAAAALALMTASTGGDASPIVTLSLAAPALVAAGSVFGRWSARDYLIRGAGAAAIFSVVLIAAMGEPILGIGGFIAVQATFLAALLLPTKLILRAFTRGGAPKVDRAPDSRAARRRDAATRSRPPATRQPSSTKGGSSR